MTGAVGQHLFETLLALVGDKLIQEVKKGFVSGGPIDTVCFDGKNSKKNYSFLLAQTQNFLFLQSEIF